MDEFQWPEEFTPFLRQLQIIVAALAVGLVTFLVVTLVVPLDPPQQPIGITYVALGFAAVALVARAIVPSVVTKLALRAIQRGKLPPEAKCPKSLARLFDMPGDVGRLFLSLFPRTIVGAAILEGACFLLLISYMLERSPLTLAAAIGFIMAVALHMPTRSSVSRWVADQAQLLRDGRQWE